MFRKKEAEPYRTSTQSPELIRPRTLRQLIIFVNLPGVVNTKISLFLEHALQRAKRLGLECSALLLLPDENEDLTHIDVIRTPPELYAGRPRGNEIQPRDHDIFRVNTKTAQNFINKIDRVDGYYDHILILGEMVRTDSSSCAQVHISSIGNIDKLAEYLFSLSESHAASTVWQRVQICHSGSLQLKSTGKTFAESITPTRTTYYSSAPSGWSVLGKNGLAIDFLASNPQFNNIISFMYTAVSNAWDEKRMQQEFSNCPSEKLRSFKISDTVLHDRFDVKCIYPKKAQYQHLFHSPLHEHSIFTEKSGISSSKGLDLNSKPSADECQDLTI
jgi:hypothetical protein